MIEHTTGQTYNEYMREHVFDPLEMDGSGFDYTEINGLYAAGNEREFGLLSKTNLGVPDYNRVPGPGGLITTIADLSKFLITQINQGAVGDAHILTPESIAQMHEKAVEGRGHINKDGYGLGFTHLSSEPWEFYGHFYGLNGAVGHEGGNIGYAGALYFIEEGQGGYGFILLTNISNIEKGADYSWYFPVYYRINVLLMEEAAERYAEKHVQ